MMFSALLVRSSEPPPRKTYSGRRIRRRWSSARGEAGEEQRQTRPRCDQEGPSRAMRRTGSGARSAGEETRFESEIKGEYGQDGNVCRDLPIR